MKKLLKQHQRKFAIKRLSLKLSIIAVFITFFLIGNQAMALNEWNEKELKKIEAPIHEEVLLNGQKSVLSILKHETSTRLQYEKCEPLKWNKNKFKCDRRILRAIIEL